jgi:hypothetical protein
VAGDGGPAFAVEDTEVLLTPQVADRAAARAQTAAARPRRRSKGALGCMAFAIISALPRK